MFAAGDLIADRYEVQSFLGDGAGGEVYRVHDQHLDVVLALKLLADVTGPWEEAQRLTELRGNPYILPVWNADFAAGVPFVVTDLAEHGSAGDRVEPIGVPPTMAIEWVRAACRGSSRMLDADLLHRDIKPDNLFVTADDRVLLGDVGHARFAADAPPGGTLETMAPELMLGANCTVASEVYSLGATLYALLAGRYAHQRSSDTQELMRQIASDEPPPLRDLAPHLSQALAKQVDKAMARHPDDRHASAAELDKALGDLPPVRRRWKRVSEHAGHDCCYLGTEGRGADVTVCAILTGNKWGILAAHVSGRRVLDSCRTAVSAGQLAQRLRVAIREVS